MPWPIYLSLTDEDVQAIFRCLRTSCLRTLQVSLVIAAR